MFVRLSIGLRVCCYSDIFCFLASVLPGVFGRAREEPVSVLLCLNDHCLRCLKFQAVLWYYLSPAIPSSRRPMVKHVVAMVQPKQHQGRMRN